MGSQEYSNVSDVQMGIQVYDINVYVGIVCKRTTYQRLTFYEIHTTEMQLNESLKF